MQNKYIVSLFVIILLGCSNSIKHNIKFKECEFNKVDYYLNIIIDGYINGKTFDCSEMSKAILYMQVLTNINVVNSNYIDIVYLDRNKMITAIKTWVYWIYSNSKFTCKNNDYIVCQKLSERMCKHDDSDDKRNFEIIVKNNEKNFNYLNYVIIKFSKNKEFSFELKKYYFLIQKLIDIDYRFSIIYSLEQICYKNGAIFYILKSNNFYKLIVIYDTVNQRTEYSPDEGWYLKNAVMIL